MTTSTGKCTREPVQKSTRLLVYTEKKCIRFMSTEQRTPIGVLGQLASTIMSVQCRSLKNLFTEII